MLQTDSSAILPGSYIGGAGAGRDGLGVFSLGPKSLVVFFTPGSPRSINALALNPKGS